MQAIVLLQLNFSHTQTKTYRQTKTTTTTTTNSLNSAHDNDRNIQFAHENWFNVGFSPINLYLNTSFVLYYYTYIYIPRIFVVSTMPVNYYYYNNDTSRSVARNYEDDHFVRIRYSRFSWIIFYNGKCWNEKILNTIFSPEIDPPHPRWHFRLWWLFIFN